MSEAVERRDRRRIETRPSSGAPFAFLLREVGVDRRVLERAPHSVSKLRCGCFGERDGDEVADLAHRAGGDEPNDTIDEDAGLPGARARLDEQVAVQVVADPRSAVVVDLEKGMLPHERRHVSASLSTSFSATSSASST